MARSGERQITLRVPERLYEQMASMAKKHHTSLNKLAREGLERLARAELEAELRSAYDTLGHDTASNVEPFLAAQSEVVTRDPA